MRRHVLEKSARELNQSRLNNPSSSYFVGEGKKEEMRSMSRRLLLLRTKFCTRWCREKCIRFLITVAVVTNIGASLWIMISERSMPEYFNADVHTSARLSSHRRCYIPNLNPYEQEIKQFMNKPEPINCQKVSNPNFAKPAFEVKQNRQGNVKTNENGSEAGGNSNVLVRKFEVGAPCCYRPFYRVSDAEVWMEPTQNFTYVCHPINDKETVIPPEHEFIEIICGFAGAVYKDAFSFVSRKASVEKRIKDKEEKKRKKMKNYKVLSGRKREEERHALSLIILGMDSTSQMNFIRMMPKSYKYLLTNLSAIQLKGYNKVGENTLPNVVPLLTGLHLAQLKKLCLEEQERKGVNSAVHLDRCPLLWKNFSRNGYRTSFAEDELNTGVFNLHWSQAFQAQPTDHYFRTFLLRMNSNHAAYEGHCFGTRMTFDILMENIKNTVDTYKHDLFFQFTWASKLSHNDFNRLAWGDNSLLKLLKHLDKNGHLNETALFLLGDHGSRNEEVRKTTQGQMEDRLPVSYVILPKWFYSKYPRAYKNLVKNAGKLTTAFDIHETLKDFLDLSKLSDPATYFERQAGKISKSSTSSSYGISLFMEIPETRGCIAAGIPQHWCICYRKKPMLTESSLVKSAARFAINSFNRILKPFQRICEPLRLYKVTRALQWKPDDFDEAKKDRKVEEEDYKNSYMIQVNFIVLPGHASFEITLMNHPNYGFKLTDEIVRMNRYEGRGDCIHQELKILCQCKKIDENQNVLNSQKSIKDKKTKQNSKKKGKI